MLKFRDDLHLQNLTVDPSKIVPHSWKKLKEIYKTLNSKYNATLPDFIRSGWNNPDYYGFTQGAPELYYLWKCLDIKPDLKGAVIRRLPDEYYISSDQTTTDKRLITPVKSRRTPKREGEVYSDMLSKMTDDEEKDDDLKKTQLEMMQKCVKTTKI